MGIERSDIEPRKPLSYEEAILLLPDVDEIHTFRSANIAIIGCHSPRDYLLEKMKKHEDTLELAGPRAMGMHHGLVLRDETGYLFIETKDVSDLLKLIKKGSEGDGN